jgi:hypothetical protein
MPASLVQGDSLLAVNIGAANTRAVLFDVVEGEYRLLASASAPSTVEAPFQDLSEGVRNAINELQTITGRTLLNADRRLITPFQPDGSGVDAFVSTLSAGPVLKIAIVGLLDEASLESALRLAEMTYSRVVDSVGLNNHHKTDQQIDTLLRLQPDIVIITGGTDGGASLSVRKMLEPVGLASYLMPEEKRPAVLFAGNQKLDDEVKGLLGNVTSFARNRGLGTGRARIGRDLSWSSSAPIKGFGCCRQLGGWKYLAYGLCPRPNGALPQPDLCRKYRAVECGYWVVGRRGCDRIWSTIHAGRIPAIRSG